MKDDQWIWIGFNTLDNAEYRKVMSSVRGIGMVYHWLKRHIVRAPMKSPLQNEVYEQYFLKGYLATTIPIRKFAQQVYLSNDTLSKALMALKNVGYIKIKKLDTRKREGNQKEQCVYILGKWTTYIGDDGNEKMNQYYFLDDKVNEPLFNQPE